MTQIPSSPPSPAFWATALAALVCAVALSLPLRADAAPLTEGSVMPTLSLNDQHGKPAPVGPATRWVVFTAEKPVSNMVSAVLAFALPQLRELPSSIALVRETDQPLNGVSERRFPFSILTTHPWSSEP